MAMFMKIDGVDGTATQEKHKKWIYIESLSWGVQRAMSVTTGGTFNREGSEPQLTEVVVTKMTDGSSPKLFQLGCGLDPIGKPVKIDFVRTSSPGDTYMTYTLHNVIISSYSLSAAGDAPSESLTLNFTKFDMKYTPLDEKLKPTQPINVSYDMSTTKVD